MKKKPVKTSPAVLVTETKETISASARDIFEKYGLQLAFLLTALIAFFIFKDYLLLKKVYLFKDIGSDTLNGLYPPMYHTADYIHQYGLPSWTFNYGMGQNIFPFFLSEPFNSILYLFGKDSMVYLIAYKEYFKVVLCGVVFFLYLKMVTKDSFTSLVGCLLFSFSGFMILGSGWYMFSFEAFNLALLLLAFEKLFQKGKWQLFPFAIALMAFGFTFNLYVYGLFLFVYSIVRYLETQNGQTIKGYLSLTGKMIYLGTLGLCISAFFLIPNIIQLIESPRGSGTSSYFNALSSAPMFGFEGAAHYKTFLSRLFSNDLMGTGINFKGWQNYLEAPIVYCGILCLVLLPQVFFMKEKKKKILYLVFILLFIIPVVFPYFRYAFWLFTGDYYRAYSFFVALSVLYVVLQLLKSISKQEQKVNLVALGVGSLILLLVLAGSTIDELKGKTVFLFTITLVILHSVTLLALSNQKLGQTAKYALVLILIAELGYMGHITANDRRSVPGQELKQKVGYNDYSIESINYIKSKDKSFFRVDKNYFSSPAMHGSLNDGLVQNYYGTSSYHSFNQLNYINFFREMGMIEPGVEIQSRWVNGLATRPLLEDICSVKYFLLKNGTDQNWRVMFDSIAQFSDIKVLKSKFVLPLGFAYHSYMLKSDFDAIKKSMRDVSLLQTFFIDDKEASNCEGLKKYPGLDTTQGYNFDKLAADVAVLKKDTLTITGFEPAKINGTLHAGEKELLFFSIPFDKGWNATVNGTKQKLLVVDGGMTGLMLEKGANTIELKFERRYFAVSLWISLLSLAVYIGLLLLSRKKSNHLN